jgi:hypothetical protein
VQFQSEMQLDYVATVVIVTRGGHLCGQADVHSIRTLQKIGVILPSKKVEITPVFLEVQWEKCGVFVSKSDGQGPPTKNTTQVFVAENA